MAMIQRVMLHTVTTNRGRITITPSPRKREIFAVLSVDRYMVDKHRPAEGLNTETDPFPRDIPVGMVDRHQMRRTIRCADRRVTEKNGDVTRRHL